MAVSNPEAYCSLLSAEVERTIYGTATPTETYLLLEYNGFWAPKAIPGSDLPAKIKERLTEWGKNLPNCKTLFIRRDYDPETNDVHFFVIRATDTSPRLHAFQLENYQSLMDLDVPAILENAPEYETHRRDFPLFLVCTHGRRDKCCAKFGLPVYTLLDAAINSAGNPGRDGKRIPQTWQVSHVGGHRYAANLICLPHGLLYGRVNPENVAAIADSYRRGQVNLPNLRGRAYYEQAAQAAEYFLREQTGDLALDSYRLSAFVPRDSKQFEVTFLENHNQSGINHHLQITIEESGQMIYQGCSLDKQSEYKKFRLNGYHTTDRT